MNLTLIIMAAGMASRYGSLKQVETFGPSGESLMEYSIYNAIKAGFEKVVFILRKNMKSDFEEKFRPKLSVKMEIKYAFQELDALSDGFKIPENRTKPWGTGHAVLMAECIVSTPFAVINADDYYGYDSFKILADYLSKISVTELAACVIGYKLRNTLSKFGSVSRAICEITQEGKLKTLTERTKIQQGTDGNIYALENNDKIKLSGNELVSMNLLGFTPPFFHILKDGFLKFLQSGPDNKLEYYLPNAITEMIQDKAVEVPVFETNEKTFGVTYLEDRIRVKEAISELILNGEYPVNLWEK